LREKKIFQNGTQREKEKKGEHVVKRTVMRCAGKPCIKERIGEEKVHEEKKNNNKGLSRGKIFHQEGQMKGCQPTRKRKDMKAKGEGVARKCARGPFGGGEKRRSSRTGEGFCSASVGRKKRKKAGQRGKLHGKKEKTSKKGTTRKKKGRQERSASKKP